MLGQVSVAMISYFILSIRNQKLPLGVFILLIVLDCCGDLPRHVGESILCVHVHCREPDWNTWYIIGEMHAVIALIVTCVRKSSNL